MTANNCGSPVSTELNREGRQSSPSLQKLYATPPCMQDDKESLSDIEKFIEEQNSRYGVVYNSAHTTSSGLGLASRSQMPIEPLTNTRVNSLKSSKMYVIQYAGSRSLQELDLLGVGSLHEEPGDFCRAGQS